MTPLEQALHQEQARIGQDIGHSDWITVDQAMIDRFAEVTMDDQWIHVDPARAAAETPFGGTIAHGFLTLSLGSRFVYDVLTPLPGQAMGINYGFDKLRFLAPVPAGARLRGHFRLLEARPRSATELLRKYALTVEIEGNDTPALAAEWLTLSLFEQTLPATN
ncbi:MaoC family dehydratase [Ruegeria pomeroyi]|nr:MaoC family dehydratase [Ruegeria pomeroyi]